MGLCERILSYFVIAGDRLEELQTRLEAQNLQQRVGVLIKLPSEVFKSCAASFLLLSVPQLSGDDHICTVVENLDLTQKSPLYCLAMASSVVSVICLLVLNSIEIKRENLLIAYLEVNDNLPFSSKAVQSQLNKFLAHTLKAQD